MSADLHGPDLRRRIAVLSEQLEEMRLRAEEAEARIASISGVTREELVKAEREACATVADECACAGASASWAACQRAIAAEIRARGGK